jgi:hypothetical protein
MAGLTDEGFEIKTIGAPGEAGTIIGDIVARQKAQASIGPNQDYTDGSALGQLNGTIANEIAEVWELAADVYASADPEAATGVAMVNVASITGTTKRGALATKVVCTVNLDPGAFLTPGSSQASVTGRPDQTFVLDPETHLTNLENGGGAAANFSATFVCTVTGPVVVNAGTLEVIDSAESGWNSITNATDGAVGRNEDTNTILRERRQAQLALRGGSTIRAIRADLLDVESTPALTTIEAVLVLENTGDSPDANGLPAHSFEVIIDDGPAPSVDNDVIAQVIFDAKPAGIVTHGLETGSAVDEYGVTHTVRFSRVVRKNVWIDLTPTTGQGFPLDGNDQIKEAIVAAGNTLNVGATVVALFLRSAAFSVPGVTDVPVFELGFSAAPSGTVNLPIGYRERAAFDTARITIV